MTLAELTLGDRCVVRRIDGTDNVCVRLMEMGLTPGCHVKYVGKAPLGDPLEFEVRGYRLSLRKSEASKVEIDLHEMTDSK